jgi:hypothetical protein
MSGSSANILDLSDEILLLISTKLKNVDVLYSLLGVGDRLDRTVDRFRNKIIQWRK